MSEIWKDIQGYEGLYQISNFGRVKSMRKEWICCKSSKRQKEETILKLCTSTQYVNFSLNKNGVKSNGMTLHTCLAKHFIPNPENKPEVNHKNGNKHDNRISNLEWVTSSENRQHAFDNGLKVPSKGSQHYKATAIMVVFLKKNTTISFPCIKDATSKTGISGTTIWSNLNGRAKSWNYKFEYL